MHSDFSYNRRELWALQSDGDLLGSVSVCLLRACSRGGQGYVSTELATGLGTDTSQGEKGRGKKISSTSVGGTSAPWQCTPRIGGRDRNGARHLWPRERVSL